MRHVRRRRDGALSVAFLTPQTRRLNMPDDTTLQSVFDYAKQGPLSGGEFPTLAAIFATFVEHFPNSHPPGSSKGSADLVTYVNGRLTLSQNKKTLSGEFRLWRNA